MFKKIMIIALLVYIHEAVLFASQAPTQTGGLCSTDQDRKRAMDWDLQTSAGGSRKDYDGVSRFQGMTIAEIIEQRRAQPALSGQVSEDGADKNAAAQAPEAKDYSVKK